MKMDSHENPQSMNKYISLFILPKRSIIDDPFQAKISTLHSLKHWNGNRWESSSSANKILHLIFSPAERNGTKRNETKRNEINLLGDRSDRNPPTHIFQHIIYRDSSRPCRRIIEVAESLSLMEPGSTRAQGSTPLKHNDDEHNVVGDLWSVMYERVQRYTPACPATFRTRWKCGNVQKADRPCPTSSGSFGERAYLCKCYTTHAAAAAR